MIKVYVKHLKTDTVHTVRVYSLDDIDLRSYVILGVIYGTKD